MKKHIVCHYKNGGLLFCTADAFEITKAYHILEVFNAHHLTSVCEPCGKSQFRVVGRMNLYYDPFAQNKMTWGEVLSRMTSTIFSLEKDLSPYFPADTKVGTNNYLAAKN